MIKFFQKDLLDSSSISPILDTDHELETPRDMLISEVSEDQITNHPEVETDDPLKTLLTWKGLSRPFRKKDRSFYTTVAVLVVLVAPFALFLGGIPLFSALLAFGFVVFVLNMVPPEEVNYKFSAQGVTISDHFYHWQELDSFWMAEKDGHKVLNILTHYKFPGVLMLLVDPSQEETVKQVCARYLPFREIVPKTIMEKWAESLQKHFPLENPHK